MLCYWWDYSNNNGGDLLVDGEEDKNKDDDDGAKIFIGEICNFFNEGRRRMKLLWEAIELFEVEKIINFFYTSVAM